MNRYGKVHRIFKLFGLLSFAEPKQTLVENQIRGLVMLRAILGLVIAGFVAVAQAQSPAPATALAPDTASRTKLQAGTDAVKAGNLRIESGARRSTALASGSTLKESEATDADDNTVRMLVAALILMVAIALRRYQAGKT